MGKSERRFRTALCGYRKGDVTAYIEKTASEHRIELLEREKIIAELQKENRSLHQQMNILMMSPPLPTPAPTPAPAAEPAAVVEPAPAAASSVSGRTAFLVQQAYRRAEAKARRQSENPQAFGEPEEKLP
jgi:hypothetical protein